MMKKLLCLLVALALCFTMFSCGGTKDSESTPNDNSGSTPPSSEEPTPTEQYDLDIATAMLTSTQYTNPELSSVSGKYGLTDAGNVGVVEANIKEKYPVPADSEFATGNVFDAADYGVVADDVLDDGVGVRQAINDAVAKRATTSKPVKVKLPKGDLLFEQTKADGVAINLANVTDLYLEGDDTVINIKTADWGVGGIFVTNGSNNVHINNISIDYVYPSIISGEILSINTTTREITIKLDDANLAAAQNFVTFFEDFGNEFMRYHEVNKYTLSPHEHTNDYSSFFDYGYNQDPYDGFEIEGNNLIVTIADDWNLNAEGKKGHYAVMSVSNAGNHAVIVDNSKNVYFENVNVYTSYLFGYVGQYSENLYFNRSNILVRPGTNRVFTTAADSMHMYEITGDLIVTNGIYECSRDDALNVKTGFYVDVVSASTSAISNQITINTANLGKIEKNSTFKVIKETTCEVVAECLVRQATNMGETVSANVKVLEGSLEQVKMTPKDYVVCMTSNSPNFLYENNIVRNKTARGLLIQCQNAVVRNNTFENVGHGAISIYTSLDHYSEASLPENVLVENNKCINNNAETARIADICVFATGSGGYAPTGTVKNVTIKNNFVYGAGNAGIGLQSATDITVDGNLLVDCGWKYSHSLGDNAFFAANVSNSVVSNNYIHNYTSMDSYYSYIKEETVENISYINNVNFEPPTLAAATTINKITSAIVIDGDLSDWENAGDIIPMVAGSFDVGTQVETEFDYFKVEFLKLGYTDEGIVFSYSVYDPTITWNEQSFWVGDAVEITMSTMITNGETLDKTVLNNGLVMEYVLGPGKEGFFYEPRTTAGIVEKASKMNTKSWLTENGYAAEGLIPFDMLTTTLLDGSEYSFKQMVDNGDFVFGLAFTFNENDNGGRLQVGNVLHSVEYSKLKGSTLQKFILG